MPINSDKPHLWKQDVERSIDFYNDWFLRFAPETFRIQRRKTTRRVLEALRHTEQLTKVTPQVLSENPGILAVLRMTTAPPLARDRLIGLAYATKSLVAAMEAKDGAVLRLRLRMPKERLDQELGRMCDILVELADRDLFWWLETGVVPDGAAIERTAMVVADRLCGAVADPIIRNAQEKRQLATLKRWLIKWGYEQAPSTSVRSWESLAPGQFAFRLNVSADSPSAPVNIPIDCAIQPLGSNPGALPLLIEAKSAGDATNTNKRRKEEAQKLAQLRRRHGQGVRFMLLLCGYFEPGYLGYEAAEGIDWIWEHRLRDLAQALETSGGDSSSGTREPDDELPPRAKLREQRRQVVQKSLDGERSAAARNKLGQFATPLPLAMEVVAKALAFLPATTPIRFLEPACGTGVFFSAFASLASPARIESRTGIELDESYWAAARDLWQAEGVSLIHADFLTFAEEPKNARLFDLLCANPPYIRHHHIDTAQKEALQRRVSSELGLLASGLSGLYVYFVLLSHAVLEDGAVASWLIPSEFLSVNYGRVLRQYLATKVTLLDLYAYDPEETQFNDALVSSCVLTYRKQKPTEGASFRYRFGGTFADPAMIREVAISSLVPATKWHYHSFDPDHDANPGELTVGDLFDVRRGIATGANKFFIMTGLEAEVRGIPAEFLRPVITSPRQLAGDVIEASATGIPCLAEPLFLLDCQLWPDQVERQFPRLWEYLEQGRHEGVADGYLCASREIWYGQERRAPAPFIISYMGRSSAKRDNPFRFIRNRSAAIVTNGFLNLYPKPHLARALDGSEERATDLLHCLNAISRDTFSKGGRSYGGGLHKIEPSELTALPLPHPLSWIQAGERVKQLALF